MAVSFGAGENILYDNVNMAFVNLLILIISGGLFSNGVLVFEEMTGERFVAAKILNGYYYCRRGVFQCQKADKLAMCNEIIILVFVMWEETSN